MEDISAWLAAGYIDALDVVLGGIAILLWQRFWSLQEKYLRDLDDRAAMTHEIKHTLARVLEYLEQQR